MGLGEWIRIGLCKIREPQIAHSCDKLHPVNTIVSLLQLAAGSLSCNGSENGMVSYAKGLRTKTRTNSVKIITTSLNFSQSSQGFNITLPH